MCMAACPCYIMCVQMPAETREDTGFPGIGSKGGCELWMWVLGPSPCPLGHLAAMVSLQPPDCFQIKLMIYYQ